MKLISANPGGAGVAARLAGAGVAAFALLATLLAAPAPSQAAVVAPARGTTIQATTAVNIRSGPGTTYEVKATAAGYDTASVLGGPVGELIEVYYRNHRGWTHRAYWNAVPGLWANGYQLTASQEAAVRWVAANTIARVPGDLSQKLTTVSRVTWWSLKESILNFSSPSVHRYSNCQNVNYDPLVTCGTDNWQVGIAGVHMSNATSQAAYLESLAGQLYGSTARAVLDHTANYAGYADGTSAHTAIVSSTGRFRTSWLARNHGVGFVFNEPYVVPCFGSAPPTWCFEGGTEALRFASSPAVITRSLQELRAILYAIRPI
ncbi:MAG TPA: hypothetical protein VFM55_14490 [Micromonosporaceae bacterium]|nr:hypothetical protein [Micromonosporaceae bacterium]